MILVSSVPGMGDVVGRAQGQAIRAECKGGIVKTKHAGQVSRLRRGLCEAVGLLMAQEKGGRQVAVVPHTEVTRRLALKLAPRAKDADIEIALVDEDGQVREMPQCPLRVYPFTKVPTRSSPALRSTGFRVHFS